MEFGTTTECGMLEETCGFLCRQRKTASATAQNSKSIDAGRSGPDPVQARCTWGAAGPALPPPRARPFFCRTEGGTSGARVVGAVAPASVRLPSRRAVCQLARRAFPRRVTSRDGGVARISLTRAVRGCARGIPATAEDRREVCRCPSPSGEGRGLGRPPNLASSAVPSESVYFYKSQVRLDEIDGCRWWPSNTRAPSSQESRNEGPVIVEGAGGGRGLRGHPSVGSTGSPYVSRSSRVTTRVTS